MLVNHAKNGVLTQQGKQGANDEQNARKGLAVDKFFDFRHRFSLIHSKFKQIIL